MHSMGLCNSPDVFQEKMNKLFAGFEYVRAYIENLLIITKGSFDHHLRDLDTVLGKLEMVGLKINATKSNFATHELEYLGYWISQDGIQLLALKAEAIKKMTTPKNRRALCSFISMINYYRTMWKKRSDLLAPLTSLTSTKSKWDWTDNHQKTFNAIKKHHFTQNSTVLSKFHQTDIHTDASDL